MIHEGKLVKTVTVAYTTYTDFDLEEIINNYNDDNKTDYKIEDVDDIRVKRNIINIEMNDEKRIEYEGILSDGDYKRPDKYLYNQF